MSDEQILLFAVNEPMCERIEQDRSSCLCNGQPRFDSIDVSYECAESTLSKSSFKAGADVNTKNKDIQYH